ncbi:hypothetical protein SAMN04487989_10861 [Bizionia echini]|uniref:Secreted protein n=1 Tax=Bizionia echini TaxID=649333 RepID=A0A1I5DIY2_9FLAO|nr:hypothetical protein [Bizionia echini]SFN99225.1 hypothetical protein SAMN04487989_10861 [Bizionia echini]
MKNVYLLVAISIISLSSFAQGANGGLSNLQGTQSNTLGQSMEALNSRGSWLPTVNRYSVDGTPLAFEEGNNKLVLVAKDGTKFNIPNGNYNAQTDQFVSVLSKDSVYVMNSLTIDYALLNNKKMKRFSGENGRARYYEVLASNSKDDMFILRNRVAKIKPGGINKMTQERTSNDRYYLVEDLYIKNGDVLEELKLKKKLISQLFKDKQVEVKKFIKDNDLNIKDETDFLKIFNYYATL